MVEITSDFNVVSYTGQCLFLLVDAIVRGRCALFSLVTDEDDRVSSERVRQLVRTPRPSATARDYLVTTVALRKIQQYWASPRGVPPSI